MITEAVPQTNIQRTDEGENPSYGSFRAEPLPRGYGHTLGNALRRVLLSSLPGAAVTAVRIEGVQHEFSTIPNVKEDVVQVVLNLKRIRLRTAAEESVKAYLDVPGRGSSRPATFVGRSRSRSSTPTRWSPHSTMTRRT